MVKKKPIQNTTLTKINNLLPYLILLEFVNIIFTVESYVFIFNNYYNITLITIFIIIILTKMGA
jgi:hypothetical protein